MLLNSRLVIFRGSYAVIARFVCLAMKYLRDEGGESLI